MKRTSRHSIGLMLGLSASVLLACGGEEARGHPQSVAWTAPSDAAVYTEPHSLPGEVIIYEDIHAALYATSSVTGAPMWSVSGDSSEQPMFTEYARSRVTASSAHDDAVWWCRAIGTDRGDLVRVDIATGSIEMLPEVPEECSSQASIVDDVAYYTGASGDVVAIDARTGNELWRTVPPYSAAHRTPTVSSGFVLVSLDYSDGMVIALDGATGTLRWSTDSAAFDALGVGEIGKDIVVAQGIGCVSDGETIVGLSIATGEIAWHTNIGAQPLTDEAPNMTASNDSMYGLTSDALVALDVESGREKWRLEGSGFLAGPTVSTNMALVSEYVSPGKSAVVGIDTSTGKRTWSLEVEDDRLGVPLLVGSDVFVGGTSGLHKLSS